MRKIVIAIFSQKMRSHTQFSTSKSQSCIFLGSMKITIFLWKFNQFPSGFGCAAHDWPWQQTLHRAAYMLNHAYLDMLSPHILHDQGCQIYGNAKIVDSVQKRRKYFIFIQIGLFWVSDKPFDLFLWICEIFYFSF